MNQTRFSPHKPDLQRQFTWGWVEGGRCVYFLTIFGCTCGILMSTALSPGPAPVPEGLARANATSTAPTTHAHHTRAIEFLRRDGSGLTVSAKRTVTDDRAHGPKHTRTRRRPRREQVETVLKTASTNYLPTMNY